MAVIINDFEVVVDSEEEKPDEEEVGREQTAPGIQLVPVDLEDVLRRRDERAGRLVAH